MALRLHGIELGLDQDPTEQLPRVAAERLGCGRSQVISCAVVRRSIDARRRPVRLVFSVDVEVADEGLLRSAHADAPPAPADLALEPGTEPLACSPLVVGAGPAGLFAGLLLARNGYRPLILERGGDVGQRSAAARAFARERRLDPECNVLFGLGGAGTFSDGKLTTSLGHPWLSVVLETMVECGAPADIRIDARPHVGTDHLGAVVECLRRLIVEAGGSVRTGVRLQRILVEDGVVAGAETTDGIIDTRALLLATGHSARDTWRSLAAAGVVLAPKPFQMGIRVEHPQSWLDRRQYGAAAGHPALGAADYKLAARIDGTPVFSFCMCPGGHTIATVNEDRHLALNGMSNRARDSAWASSGIVATVDPAAHGLRDLDACLKLVRGVESSCFAAGGGDYRAPAQLLRELASGAAPSGNLPETSYGPGVAPARLEQLLPAPVSSAIRGALPRFDRTLPGYMHEQALALAPESRASSPIRIARDRDTGQAIGIDGLYPAGEGSGYAGGIMSSALDGMAAAARIVERFAPRE